MTPLTHGILLSSQCSLPLTYYGPHKTYIFASSGIIARVFAVKIKPIEWFYQFLQYCTHVQPTAFTPLLHPVILKPPYRRRSPMFAALLLHPVC